MHLSFSFFICVLQFFFPYPCTSVFLSVSVHFSYIVWFCEPLHIHYVERQIACVFVIWILFCITCKQIVRQVPFSVSPNTKARLEYVPKWEQCYKMIFCCCCLLWLVPVAESSRLLQSWVRRLAGPRSQPGQASWQPWLRWYRRDQCGIACIPTVRPPVLLVIQPTLLSWLLLWLQLNTF